MWWIFLRFAKKKFKDYDYRCCWCLFGLPLRLISLFSIIKLKQRFALAVRTVGRFALCVLFVVACSTSAKAGVVDTLHPPFRPATHSDTFATGNKMDIVDLFKKMFGIRKNPFHKKVEQNSLGPFYTLAVYPGYAIATGIAVVAPVNISFRTKGNPDGNLSFVNNNFQYTQHNQIIVQSLSNFYTNDNKWQFPGDIRYFHFPTTTFGLGSASLPSNADGIDYSHFRFYRTVLRQVYQNTFIGLGYNLDYRWHIVDDNASAGETTSFQKYGYTKSSLSSGPSLNFLFDSRDNANRPFSGSYFNFQYVSYLKPLGSFSNWSSMTLDLRKYFLLTKKWYVELAVWGYGWFTLNGKPPYLDLPSTGWDSYNNTGRGYAAGRFRGRDMLYTEVELRFDIMRNGFLGLVVFGNLQSLTQPGGKYFDAPQPGGGAGIRIKFNKHTNSNSALDYGFGTHSSRGFATNINEVF